MTPEQPELFLRLEAMADRHGWSLEHSRTRVAAGPRVFDVSCTDGAHTLWHWVGTSDEIAGALDQWIERRTVLQSR
jgi:hypothetical protein